MIQAHVIFSGTVQGVGFRFTTQRLARGLGLVGWVKNLRTGQVEMLAEGQKKTVEELLNRIEESFGRYIRAKDVHLRKSEGLYSDFQIAYE